MFNPAKIQDGDKQFLFASIVAPLVLWWIFTGRKRYSVKGMK